MLTKRVISCLDVRDGKLAKSVKFVDTKDIGDPVEKAREYYEAGLDELVFYDITASHEGRGIMLDVVRRVAAQVFIPFSVGGGLRSVSDAGQVLEAGAEKLPFADGEFDCAVATLVICTVPDPVASLAEIRRVLKRVETESRIGHERLGVSVAEAAVGKEPPRRLKPVLPLRAGRVV